MALLSVALGTGFAQEDSKRVLFIGNSYTYFGNLPHSVEAMCKAMDFPLEAYQSTIGGANLGEHWRGDRELNSRSLIDQGDWDYVVLQDFSLSAVRTPDSLHKYGHLLIDEIQEIGAEPMMYMTWAREFNPLMIDKIRMGYEQLARTADARISPVGLVWQRARALRPDLDIYDSDGSHPSALGTYLTACVFYGVITGSSPVGLPNVLKTKDEDGEKTYLHIVNGGDAAFCQEITDRVLTEYGAYDQ